MKKEKNYYFKVDPALYKTKDLRFIYCMAVRYSQDNKKWIGLGLDIGKQPGNWKNKINQFIDLDSVEEKAEKSIIFKSDEVAERYEVCNTYLRTCNLVKCNETINQIIKEKAKEKINERTNVSREQKREECRKSCSNKKNEFQNNKKHEIQKKKSSRVVIGNKPKQYAYLDALSLNISNNNNLRHAQTRKIKKEHEVQENECGKDGTYNLSALHDYKGTNGIFYTLKKEVHVLNNIKISCISARYIKNLHTFQ